MDRGIKNTCHGKMLGDLENFLKTETFREKFPYGEWCGIGSMGDPESIPRVSSQGLFKSPTLRAAWLVSNL